MRLTPVRLIAHALVLDADTPPPRPAWMTAAASRRLDPLARLACAAVDPLIVAHGPFAEDTAVVFATAYGSVQSTLRFANDLAAYGDAGGSPSAFTASVHNAAAGNLGELLGLHGQVATISHGSLSALAALRWALLLLAGGRATRALVVACDHHNAWTQQVVTELTGSPWLIAGGAMALLLEAGSGAGRELRLGEHPAPVALDAGAPRAVDERWLARMANGQERHRAADQHARWWPTATLAGLSTDDLRAAQARASDGGERLSLWLGPQLG